MKEDITDLLHIDTIDLENTQVVEQTVQKYKAKQTPIPANNMFSKKNLERMPEHKWMKQFDMNLIHCESKDPSVQKDFLDNFIDQIVNEADCFSKEIAMKEELPILSVDLETTGLNNQIHSIGGKIEHKLLIVGVCLSTLVDGVEKGYYLPVMHTEADKINNFDYNTICWFLEEIDQEFFTIYHNANYDREVMSINKIKLNHLYTDTMWLAIASGMRAYKGDLLGLKYLSEELLERKMLELTELMGEKHIQLTRLPASNTYVYGNSDAINTLGLFCYFVLEAGEENPFYNQSKVMKLDTKTADASRAMFRFGLPIDYKDAKLGLKTTLRRIIIAESKFYETATQDVSISSPEQLGTYIGSMLYDQFVKHHITDKNLSPKAKNDLVEKFIIALQDKFTIVRKVKKLKAGDKVVYNSPDSVIQAIIKKITDWDWLDKEVQDELYWACYYVNIYRGLQHDAGLLGRFVRYAKADDTNCTRVGVGLKFNGAVTTRFTNQGGVGDSDRVRITEGAKGRKNGVFVQGDGIVGINAQGVPSRPLLLTKAYKLDKSTIPKDILERLEATSEDTEDLYQQYLIDKVSKTK